MAELKNTNVQGDLTVNGDVQVSGELTVTTINLLV
jgi:hypothetical protein